MVLVSILIDDWKGGLHMKIFQKLQLLSSIIPNISPVFVLFVTFLYCCRVKKYYIEFFIKGALYVVLFGELWNWIAGFDCLWLTYLVSVPIVLLFNYFLEKLQIRCNSSLT